MTTPGPGPDGGEVISNYRLDRVIGRGGMGVVYEATDTRNGSKVALKLLHEDLEEDPTFRERFQREAHVAALLRSPYTVHLIDYGLEQGRYFLVMNLVDGTSVRNLLRSGPMPPAQALRLASQAARALEEAEARGVVHRDIKPDNIMRATDGTAQVMDFGIARQAGASTLTATGGFIGTLSYASPEATEGQTDHRSDIWSLGATLYHMLSGRAPFEGGVIALHQQLRDAPMPREPLRGLPEAVIDAIARCLEKDPDDRFQSASALAGTLEHLAVTAARDSAVAGITATEALDARPESGTGDDGVDTDGETSAITLLLRPRGWHGRLTPGRSRASYDLVFQNTGPMPIALQLDASNPDSNCEIDLPDLIAIPPMSETTVTVNVAPRRRRWRGPTERREFRRLRRGRRPSHRRGRRVRGPPRAAGAGRSRRRTALDRGRGIRLRGVRRSRWRRRRGGPRSGGADARGHGRR